MFPLTLGAITTVGAFLKLRLAHAPLCYVTWACLRRPALPGPLCSPLIFLPHLLKEKRKEEAPAFPKSNLIDKIALLRPEGNKWLLLLVIIATPVLWHFARKVQFDGDLMHLNYMSAEKEAAQEELNCNNAYALSSVLRGSGAGQNNIRGPAKTGKR